MKQFIAELGYTMAWAFTIPQQTLEENFDGYYRFGLYMLILMAVVIIVCSILLTIILIKEKIDRKKEKQQ